MHIVPECFPHVASAHFTHIMSGRSRISACLRASCTSNSTNVLVESGFVLRASYANRGNCKWFSEKTSQASFAASSVENERTGEFYYGKGNPDRTGRELGVRGYHFLIICVLFTNNGSLFILWKKGCQPCSVGPGTAICIYYGRSCLLKYTTAFWNFIF